MAIFYTALLWLSYDSLKLCSLNTHLWSLYKPYSLSQTRLTWYFLLALRQQCIPFVTERFRNLATSRRQIGFWFWLYNKCLRLYWQESHRSTADRKWELELAVRNCWDHHHALLIKINRNKEKWLLLLLLERSVVHYLIINSISFLPIMHPDINSVGDKILSLTLSL